jgi:flagellar basal body-associated protein FliL
LYSVSYNKRNGSLFILREKAKNKKIWIAIIIVSTTTAAVGVVGIPISVYTILRFLSSITVTAENQKRASQEYEKLR